MIKNNVAKKLADEAIQFTSRIIEEFGRGSAVRFL